jgi:hypothetical protein
MAAQAMASGPKQDPDMRKIELEAQARQMDLAFKQKSQEADLAFKTQQAEQERQLKEMELQHTARLKEMEFQHSAQLEQFKVQSQAELERHKIANQTRLQEQDMAHRHAMGEREHSVKQQQFERDGQAQDREFQHKMIAANNQEQFDREKLDQERLAGDQQLQFNREKMNNDMLAQPIQAGGEGGEPTSLGAVIAALRQAIQQQGQLMISAMQQIAEQNAQAIRVASSPRPRLPLLRPAAQWVSGLTPRPQRLYPPKRRIHTRRSFLLEGLWHCASFA